MPTNENADPAVEDAARRAERAKASLLSRVEALKDKLGDARRKLDLPAQIAMHPLPAVGIALAIGALAGRRGARTVSAAMAERSLGATALAAIGAVGLRIVREIAISQLSRAARQWAEAPGEADEFAGDATIRG